MRQSIRSLNISTVNPSPGYLNFLRMVYSNSRQNCVRMLHSNTFLYRTTLCVINECCRINQSRIQFFGPLLDFSLASIILQCDSILGSLSLTKADSQLLNFSFKIILHTLLRQGSNFPPTGREQRSNFHGLPRGMLKQRIDRCIISLSVKKLTSTIFSSISYELASLIPLVKQHQKVCPFIQKKGIENWENGKYHSDTPELDYDEAN